MLVKEIITEAAVRVNLAPQRNPYPTVVENGFRLLKVLSTNIMLTIY